MARKRRRGGKRRHRRHVVARANPFIRRKGRRRGSRRGFRRNPGGGIVGRIIEAAKGAAFATAGKAASRAIPSLAGIQPVGVLGLLTQAGAGVGVALLSDRFIGRQNSRDVMLGALQGVIESAVRGANVPILSPALGDETELYSFAGYAPQAAISGYAPGASMAAGMGDGLMVMG